MKLSENSVDNLDTTLTGEDAWDSAEFIADARAIAGLCGPEPLEDEAEETGTPCPPRPSSSSQIAESEPASAFHYAPAVPPMSSMAIAAGEEDRADGVEEDFSESLLTVMDMPENQGNGFFEKADDLREWHMLLADAMIQNPGATNTELAYMFKKDTAYISRIRNSDGFKAFFSARLLKHQDIVSKEIVSKAGKVALAGLSCIEDKISRHPEKLSMSEVTRATEVSGKMLGFGVGGTSVTTQVAIEIGDVDRDLLAKARENLHKLGEHNSREVLEGEVEDERKIQETSAYSGIEKPS